MCDIGKDCDFIPDAGVYVNAPEFDDNCTGLENLLILSKIRKRCSRDYIIELARMMDFDDDINKKYKNYSLGMKQKMRFIQAIMEDPKYLILDEPFDSLDERSVTFIKEYLVNFIKRNDKYIIYTSHNTNLSNFTDLSFSIENYTLIKK